MNKTVRLPDGRFITRKIVESSLSALAQAKPEEIWTMNDGKSNSGKTTYTREILIRDMATSHIMNAMNVIFRREYEKLLQLGTVSRESITQSVVVTLCLETVPQYRVLRDELEIRLGRKQRAPEPVPEHAGRKFDFT